MNTDKKKDDINTPTPKKTGIMKFFTSQTESPETSGVKLFPIFSRPSATKSTPVSKDIELVQNDNSPCVSSESSKTDHDLCIKDGSLIEVEPMSKKSTSVKRKRNSCEEFKTTCSQDDAQLIKSSEEITSLSLKRTKVLCSPDNGSTSKLFPIFNNSKSNYHSPKLDEFVSKEYNTTIDSGATDDPSLKNAVTSKKRGRKPGSKLINSSVCQPNSSGEGIKKKRGRPRKETPCSTGEKSFDSSSGGKALEVSSSTPLTEVIKKKRGRPRKETWVTRENNSGTSSMKAETPKKRGRKPGTSLLKRLDENLAKPFEDLTGSPRKRQKVVLFCAGVDDEDNHDVSESDDTSVLSVSLSSDESSTSGSNSKVSVAAALNNMIMKSHQKKKCKEPRRSSSEAEEDTPLSNIKKSLYIEENKEGSTTENPVSRVEVSEKTNSSPDSYIGSSKNLKTPTPKATSLTSSTPESINVKPCKKTAKKQVDILGRRTSSRLKDSVSFLNDDCSSSLDIAEICTINSKVQDNKVNSVIEGSKNSKSNDLQKAKCIKSKELVEDCKLFPLFTKKQTVSINNNSQTDNVSNKIIEKLKKNKKTEGSLSAKKKNEIQEEATEVELNSSENSLNSETDLKFCYSNKSIPAMENHSAMTKIQEPISYRKPLSRSFDNHLSFPLQTHFNASLSTEKSFEYEKLVTEDEKPETLVQIPLWSEIVGLTSIKSLKDTKPPKHTLKTPKKSVKIKEQVDYSLWTEIESDYDLKEGVSESTISELNLWLQMWKSKFTKLVKKSHKDKEDSSDSFSDSDGSDEDENSNGIIIMGPPGSGKTSLVFSLAAKHGFKVLEVNASSCRSGRNVSHQLKEALESYHVENTKVPEFGAAMFDSKQALGENVRDNIQKASKKGLLNFLKSNEGGEKNNNPNQTKEFTGKDKKSLKKERKQSSSKKTDQNKESTKDSSCTISGQTIILFDDIDVVFEEDEGLWSTIRGFLKISKKPVIFTVSRNLELVRNNIDLDMQVLYLKPMIKEVAYEKLISQCKKYGRDNTNVNFGNLLPSYSYDLRRSLLHAQFWSQSLPSQKTTSPNNLVNHLSINTFGSADFSAADLSSLISNSMCYDVSLALSKYHKLGYDILHCNLYPLFNVASALEVNLQWSAGVKTEVCIEENSNEDLSHKVRKKKTDTTKSNLWQEACKLFESKRKSLQSGSSSSDLFVFADIIEDFSFSDFLKGMATEEMNWFSIPERVKMWNLGWPVCSDFNLVYNDFIPEMISTIQILCIQVAKGRPLKCKLDKAGKESLVLLHPLTTELDLKIKNHLDCIASALPPNLLLNKTVLKMDYLSILKLICQKESIRQIASGKRSNRFLHYFDAISLLIDKYQIEQILDNFV